MSTCLKDVIDMIFFRLNIGFCSFDTIPLAGSDLELVLVLYRISQLILKTRLHTKLLYTLSRALLQGIRISAEYFENLPLLSEAFSLFNGNPFNGRMRLLRFHPFFESIDV